MQGNKINSENGHLGFSIFKKNKKTTESVIFRLYFKDIVKPIDYITNKLCYISTKFNHGKMYLDNQVKHNEGMRGPMKCYKNKDNCLLALSTQFNSGILRFMSNASSISN